MPNESFPGGTENAEDSWEQQGNFAAADQRRGHPIANRSAAGAG
jgi:hypothetical protein